MDESPGPSGDGVDNVDQDDNDDNDDDDDDGVVSGPTVEAYVNLAKTACKYCVTRYILSTIHTHLTHSTQRLPGRCCC